MKINLIESALFIQDTMHGTKELKRVFEKAYKDGELEEISSILEMKKKIIPKLERQLQQSFKIY